jgi:translation initiation factor 1A
MPKNKGKGGKNRRRGKNENEEDKRELVYKEDGQGFYFILFLFWIFSFNFCFMLLSEYAQVTKMLGNGHLEAYCFDDMKRICHIRGKLRKKVLMHDVENIFIS